MIRSSMISMGTSGCLMCLCCVVACSSYRPLPQDSSNVSQSYTYTSTTNYSSENYSSRLPAYLDTDGKKLVLVDPNVHAWGAYDSSGQLIRAGIATSGSRNCPADEQDEPHCQTGVGTFHISSLGGPDCYSKKYPKPEGGGLMPYCMFFNGGQALHGSPDDIVIERNVSHGCIRMRIPDAEWMRYNFAQVGTRVVVKPYDD